ncbi:MAG TPA: DegQ family serine endoprotease [Rhizomicrobium sp.]
MHPDATAARKPGLVASTLARVAAVMLLSLASASCGRQNDHDRQVGAALRAHAPPDDLPTLAPMLAKVSPAVVNISVQGTIQVAENPAFQDPLFRQFFGIPEQPQTERFQAVGSGVIIDAARGLIVTNNHVVKNAQEIQVTLKDRRQRSAKLIGADPQTDIAVLQIPADNLKDLPLGASKDLRVGDYVVAIGDPFGIGQTATFGIVSALGRTGLGIENYEDFIQTDASINPGNSGGALVNMAGQLIGMNTAILSRSGGNVGVGFAIPVDMVRTIARELIESGKISRGALGVSIQDLTPGLARAMGMKISAGALVSQVQPNSPAAKAGIKSGDVVTQLNGASIASGADLRNAVGEESPGTDVRLTLLRNGRQQTVSVTLEALNAAAGKPAPAAAQPQTKLLSGVTTGAIPQSDPNYGTANGVYVENVDPASAAANAGLDQGDIIVSVDRTPVATTSDLDRVLRKHPQGKPVLLQIRRANATLFLAIG